MEEELKEWVVPLDYYRDVYDNWISAHCNDIRSIENEELMWKEYSIYTDSEDLEYDSKFDESRRTFNLRFKIKDFKKFSMARLKYDF